MERIFIPIYRFLRKNKIFLWSSLVISTLVFVFFGLQLNYEENIAKLLPQTESSSNSGLAFGNLRVKDKIFIQIASKDSLDVDSETLAYYCDDFMYRLSEKDTESYIANSLYQIDDDLKLSGMDYLLCHLPEFVDTSCYANFDSYLSYESIQSQMAKNAQLLQDDEEGTISMLVGYDPLGLRNAMLESGLALKSGLGGFKIKNGHFFSSESNVVLAFVSPNFGSMDSKAGESLISMIEKEIDSFEEENPEIQVFLHGSPVMSVNNSRRIKSDLFITVGLSLLLICFIIALCFKNKSSLLLLLAPVVYGTFFSLACMFWIKGTMSLMAIGIGAVVLGVALSYCLHVLTHYKYVSDPEVVLKDQSTPVFLGCLTTIGAFAGLLFTSSELLKDFGLFASFAMVGTTFFSLVYLPHFFKPERNKRSRRAFKVLDKLNSYPIQDKKWVVRITLILIVICVLLPSPKFDNNLKNINYVNPKVQQSIDMYNAGNNHGLSSQYYASSHTVLDSAFYYQQFILASLDSLEKEGMIGQYSKISSLFLTTEQQQERIEAWSKYWEKHLPSTKQKISQAAKTEGINPQFFESFYSLCEAEYKPESLYESGVLPESLLSNFIEKTENGTYMLFTSVLLPDSLKMTVNKIIDKNPHAIVIDPFFYTGDMVEIIHNDFDTVLWISMTFVFFVLLLSFRSFGVSLVAFLPMALSWFIVQAVMWTFDMQFNLINIVIATFIFGIGVDYSIFTMQGLLSVTSGKDTGLLTYHKTAISLSAMILVVVTGSLLFAVHPAIRSIGVSSIIGMTATIILTYLLEPVLFNLLLKIPFYQRKLAVAKNNKNE